MKFEKYLKRNIYPPYKYYYIDYQALRKSLLLNSFVPVLDSNINRVNDFIKLKTDEIQRRLEKSSSVKQINDELKHFAEFIRINIVGLKTIIKKYDKKNSSSLYQLYRPKLKTTIKELDSLLYESSKITLSKLKHKKKESNNVFIRKTDKYWVHKNNINTLKFYILRHLPIYVYTKNDDLNKWDINTHDTSISSVYLDNEEYKLYNERLRKLQNSEAIRIRWYGKNIPETVFIERKRHEDGWTGNTSKKLRFIMSESKVQDFLNGVDVYDDVMKYNDNTEDIKKLYYEIQQTIIKNNLKPMVRTCYERIAFQLPNDSSVRISLDTELRMIKENQEYWRRSCHNLLKEEVVDFPYAILEIKTQSFDETKPEWINELVNGVLVEHVHKFSKYLHGMSVLYPDITNIPYWLPQMTTKILKDPFETETEYKEFNNNVLIDINPNTEMVDSDHLSPVDIVNKRISIPVRVEPKVFFANERTFLSWVQFAIFLGGIGTAMVGSQSNSSTFGGVILIIVSIIFSFYALYLYLWRAGMIRRREPGPYDDLYGPPILVCVFLFAMCLAIIYKFPLKRVI